jgi:hypothetical protein
MRVSTAGDEIDVQEQGPQTIAVANGIGDDSALGGSHAAALSVQQL